MESLNGDKFWAGLYERAGQYLNVNRGFGYLAFPGRVVFGQKSQ